MVLRRRPIAIKTMPVTSGLLAQNLAKRGISQCSRPFREFGTAPALVDSLRICKRVLIMNATPNAAPARASLGVVIRFKNGAATLPVVLAALRRQTVQPALILGVDNLSTDVSGELLRAAGGIVINWTQAYHHPRVLNFALRHCPTDLVMVLSSHTVLESPETMEQLMAAMADPRTACASAKWDDDPFYSDAIDWRELQTKGLKFCSIHSNSMGILRRSLWEQVPFDESLPTMEDGAWALEQIKRGYLCRRLKFPFTYKRGGSTRDYVFAVLTFQLAARHGLAVTWLGVLTTLRKLARAASEGLAGHTTLGAEEINTLRQRLIAWATWRFVRPARE